MRSQRRGAAAYRRSSLRAVSLEVVVRESLEQKAGLDVECPGDPNDPGHASVAVPSLHAGDLADAQPRVVSQLRLGPVAPRTLALIVRPTRRSTSAASSSSIGTSLVSRLAYLQSHCNSLHGVLA